MTTPHRLCDKSDPQHPAGTDQAPDVAPRRIQLSRRRGYRKPAGAVVVSRPSKWGNPFRWDSYPATRCDDDGEVFRVSDGDRRRWSVVDFKAAILHGIGDRPAYPSDDEIRAELRGRNLACWCPLDQPCHADVLLEIANSTPAGGAAC